ncbi:MAG TPA: prolyl oligopeptidase family serine peptidase [Terriglobales bacterium]|jgi:prolyl oligopeptidase|nr:prolyl oligopeptidase family serine peptidase [Terriglobales bacterium]
MQGVLRLVWFLSLFLLSSSLVVVLAVAEDNAATNAPTPASPAPPKPQPIIVEETIHGHKIADPFRWLEDGESPASQQFVRDELAYTRSRLDPLPGREAIHARLTELWGVGVLSTPQVAGDYYFYLRREGQVNQPVLYVRKGLNGTDRALVDPNTLVADGTVSLDWSYPSHDGKYLAYGTSPSGSEISTLHIIATETGKPLPDIIERTRAASLAWMPDDSGFYYTRYPKPGEVPPGQEMYNRHVFYHALGSDPGKDPLIFGEGGDAQDWPNLVISDDGKWLLIQVQQGWTKAELFLKNTASNAAPVRLTSGKEFLYSGDIFGNGLYITTNEDAPRYRVMRASLSSPDREHWKEIIPESTAVLSSADIVGGKIFTHYQQDATSRLKLFSTEGKFLHDIPLPGIGNLEDLTRGYQLGGQHESQEAFFVYQSFTQPMTAYRYDLKTSKVSLFAGVKAPVDPSAYESKQVFYNSKDGTRVPMFIVHKKGLALNGHNPVLLTGYGGFNVTNSPVFLRGTYLWLEHGGVYALANLRGGAEYGEQWHRAGMLDKKQNVFDDFIAAGEYLIAEKYTDKDHLAIQGGSNGGLLMGAALTQRPDLFRAVICQVPLLDMLRYQNFQIARLWIPEYGSADDPKQFEWLYAYSPYHHVKPGTLYPSVLFMTADSDTRVDPMHAKKMAALLQNEAANGPDRPILLRIEPKAGHGAGKPISKSVEESTDIYSFLFWQLGVK